MSLLRKPKNSMDDSKTSVKSCDRCEPTKIGPNYTVKAESLVKNSIIDNG